MQLENSITAIKRLNDSLEYGVSLELISGPALSFHCRVVHHLLLKSNQNVIKALGLNVLQVLIGSLESLKKAINFNSIGTGIDILLENSKINSSYYLNFDLQNRIIT